MKEIVWICFTTAKDYILPLKSLTQQTKSHPSRKKSAIPQRNVMKRGQAIVSKSISLMKYVRRRETIVIKKRMTPSTKTGIFELKYPLMNPPIIAPIPFDICNRPTLKASEASSSLSRLLKLVVVNPSKKPSRAIAGTICIIEGQNFNTFSNSVKKCFFSWGSFRALISSSVQRESRKKYTKRKERTPMPVRTMKYVWLPKSPRAKVVTAPPKITCPQIIPLWIPIYCPSSRDEIRYFLNSFTIYPP